MTTVSSSKRISSKRKSPDSERIAYQVTLDRDVIRLIKHAAADADVWPGRIIEDLARKHLNRYAGVGTDKAA